MSDQDVSTPHPVDVHVGLRIKLRRTELGVSQERLAEALNLTFQQVQKYERAINRVSASKIVEIAQALRAPVSYFFESVDVYELEAREALLKSSTGLKMLRAYGRLPGRLRRIVAALVEALAQQASDAETAVSAAPRPTPPA